MKDINKQIDEMSRLVANELCDSNSNISGVTAGMINEFLSHAYCNGANFVLDKWREAER